MILLTFRWYHGKLPQTNNVHDLKSFSSWCAKAEQEIRYTENVATPKILSSYRPTVWLSVTSTNCPKLVTRQRAYVQQNQICYMFYASSSQLFQKHLCILRAPPLVADGRGTMIARQNLKKWDPHDEETQRMLQYPSETRWSLVGQIQAGAFCWKKIWNAYVWWKLWYIDIEKNM